MPRGERDEPPFGILLGNGPIWLAQNFVQAVLHVDDAVAHHETSDRESCATGRGSVLPQTFLSYYLELYCYYCIGYCFDRERQGAPDVKVHAA